MKTNNVALYAVAFLATMMPASAEVINKRGEVLTQAALESLAKKDKKIAEHYAAIRKASRYQIVKSSHSDSDVPDYKILEARTGKVIAHLPKDVIPESGSCFPEPTDEGLVMVEIVAASSADKIPQRNKPGIFNALTGKMLRFASHIQGRQCFLLRARPIFHCSSGTARSTCGKAQMGFPCSLRAHCHTTDVRRLSSV